MAKHGAHRPASDADSRQRPAERRGLGGCRRQRAWLGSDRRNIESERVHRAVRRVRTAAMGANPYNDRRRAAVVPDPDRSLETKLSAAQALIPTAADQLEMRIGAVVS